MRNKNFLGFTVTSFILVCAFCSGFALSVAFADEKAPPKVYDLAKSTLAKYGSDPVIVKAVKAENAKNKSLGSIQALDKKWKNTPGVVDYMKALITSECGRHLTSIVDDNPYLLEIFVMDNQGANVAMSNKTSDYWQGDEAKFTESYNKGKGSIHVSDVEFDDSAQAYLAQVSVPVISGGRVIGAITFGVDIDLF